MKGFLHSSLEVFLKAGNSLDTSNVPAILVMHLHHEIRRSAMEKLKSFGRS